jgi:GntR family transcriptional regulator
MDGSWDAQQGERVAADESDGMTEGVQTWHQDRPIYRQLMEQIVARILDNTYREGEMLPSVRQLASDFVVNPLTAARAYRELEEYTETRRGIGLVVREGVRELLLKREQRRFLREEWPAIRERIKALDLDVLELLKNPAKL